MKILTLDLIAYGHFTDRTLIFPQDKGLFVLFGPNEAGKSTCLRALKGLLFGITKNTTDAFLHGMPKLRIGGTLLRSDGKRIEVVRRKGMKDTLLGPNKHPVPEETLRPFLGSVDQETFSRMFGINRHELVEGGKLLIEGGGGLGESLFVAGLGGVDLRGLLESLEEEAAQLFKPGGSTPVLNADGKAFRELRSKVRELSLSVQAWNDLDEALNRLKDQSEALTREISSLTGRKEALERIRDALPAIEEMREKNTRFLSLKDVKILGEDFTRKREEAQQDIGRATPEERAAKEKLTELDGLLASLQVPESLLAQEKTVQGMVQDLGGIRKAKIDLPGVQAQVNEAHQTAKSILKELRPDLTLEEAGSIRLTVERRQKIQSLTKSHQMLVQKRGDAAERVSEESGKIEGAKRELAGLRGTKDISDLDRSIGIIRKKGDLDDAYANTMFEAREARQDAEEVAKSLYLWGRGLDHISTLQVPTEAAIDEFVRQFEAIDRNIEKAGEGIRESEEKVREIDSKLETLRLSGEVPTEEDLIAARSRREQGWTLVKFAWLDGKRQVEQEEAYDPELPLSGAYEKSVSEADTVSDRMRREAEGVAQKASLLAERGRQEERASRLRSEETDLKRNRADVEAQWLSQWVPTGISPKSPKVMKDWRQKQQDLVRRAGEIKKLDALAEKVRDEAEGCKKILRDHFFALGEKGPPQDAALEDLLQYSESFVREEERVSSDRDKLLKEISEADKALAKAHQEEQKALEALSRWSEEWSAVVKGLSDTLSVDTATAFLDKCAELFTRLDQSAKDADRVHGMRGDISGFSNRVKEFVVRVAPDLAGVDVEQAVLELSSRVSRAKTDAAQRKQVMVQREDAKKSLEKARGTILGARARIEVLLKEAGCNSEEELPSLELKSAEARQLQKEVSDLERQVRVLAAGRPLPEFIKEAERANPEQIREDIRNLSALLLQKQGSLSEVNQQIGALNEKQNSMDGRADAAQSAQDAQELLQKLRENTEKYLRLRLAWKVLKAEIERYRERNQGPVLRRASDIFSAVTEGRFRGLDSDYDAGDVPVLFGVRPDGMRVYVYGMSDGTQDQLYLALRLATLEKYLSENEPIPLVVDDALVNFDDDRARAGLKVLADLAKKTQVLFFTHHRHLVELAVDCVDREVLHHQAI